METLNDLLDAAAASAGGRTALVSDGERITFSELREESLRIASNLERGGISAGSRVAIVMRNGIPFIASYFAIVRLGATAVPINFMIQNEEELSYLLRDSQAAAAVTQPHFLPGLRRARGNASALQTIWVLGTSAAELRPGEKPYEDLRAASLRTGLFQAAAGDVAAVLYTSGTTGSPKGAMLTHGNLLSNALDSSSRLGLSSRDSQLALLPMFHTFAWTANVLVSLAVRSKLVIVDSVTPPAPWLRLMAKEKVTLFSAIPQVYSLLAREASASLTKRLALRYWFFRNVRLAISGAAPLGPEIHQAFERALGVPLLEGYGLTETSPIVAVNTLSERRRGTVGRPIPGVSVRILDQAGRALETGEEGEVAVRGPNVMKGYLGKSQESADVMTGDGYFKTGDIGILDADGYLSIRDRAKDMIIVKGLKVFPAHLERVLSEHPAVAESAVIGIPGADGSELIKAFVVLKPGSRAGKSEILEFCRERLDAYKRPRALEIVESLPKNSLQKVLKNELRRRETAARKASP